MLKGNILITGGTGSLGTALVKRALGEQWDCTLTIYSRDEMKQQALARAIGQDKRVRFAIGDVADYDTLERVMVGHATVIHAAAFKHIPAGELNVGAMLQTNVVGSQNVIAAALRTGVTRVLGISTDKACHPVNAYGCSKMLMERLFQEADALGLAQFHLVRYGNVLDSTGSVIPLWRKQVEAGQPITVTDARMTRFWLTVEEAVDLVLRAFETPHGNVLVPLLPGLAMGKFAAYLFGAHPQKDIGLRPGEKMHEELLTPEESTRARRLDRLAEIAPPTEPAFGSGFEGHTSDLAAELTRAELLEMVAAALGERQFA